MKRLALFAFLLFAAIANAQLTVDLSSVALSKGDPIGFGSLTAPPVYNTVTSTVFRWNGAAWTGMTGVLLTGNVASLQATGTDPTGRACIGIVPVINTTSKQTFGCIDGLMGPVNVSASSGSGTLTSVTITGTAGQVNVSAFCASTTVVTCTLSIPSVFTLPGTINKIILTSPATNATITIADGKTFTANSSLTFAGTDGKTITFNNTMVFNGTDGTTYVMPNPASVTSGNCAALTKSGSTVSIVDAMVGPCGSGGGGAGAAYQLTDYLAQVASSSVMNIGAACNVGVCNNRSGSLVSNFAGGTITISSGATSDDVYVFLFAGAVSAYYSQTEVLSCVNITCSSGPAAFPPGSIPLWKLSMTGAGWTAISIATMDKRSVFGIDVYSAGTCFVSTPNPSTGIQVLSIDPTCILTSPAPGTTINLNSNGSGPTNRLAIGKCTGTCTVTVPPPAKDLQFCVMNDVGVSTVITLAALGSGNMYSKTDRSAYGTANTAATSPGLIGDFICLLGRDATHYIVTANSAGWTIP